MTTKDTGNVWGSFHTVASNLQVEDFQDRFDAVREQFIAAHFQNDDTVAEPPRKQCSGCCRRS